MIRMWHVCLPVLLMLALVGAWPAAGWSAEEQSLPGLGFFGGLVEAGDNGEGERFGLNTRRIRDQDRTGSLALVGERINGGVKFKTLSPDVSRESVEVQLRSVHLELKRYFDYFWRFSYYWGLRGGYSELSGTVRPEGMEPSEFRTYSFAPLALLALPFMLEDPGFIMLALVDGASAGLIFDLAPQHVWLDFQLGAIVLPSHQDRYVAISQNLLLTRAASLVVAF